MLPCEQADLCLYLTASMTKKKQTGMSGFKPRTETHRLTEPNKQRGGFLKDQQQQLPPLVVATVTMYVLSHWLIERGSNAIQDVCV